MLEIVKHKSVKFKRKLDDMNQLMDIVKLNKVKLRIRKQKYGS